MSMLAERKRKNKWILLPKRAPDKPIWTTDSESLKFGQKLMEKMGWSAGKGLGANEQGIQEPLRVSYKNDTKGMGYKLNDAEWIEQQEEFNELLNQLSVTTDSKPKETNENSDTQIKSLEEKSKKSRSRVHYKKFTRGKDLSRYSENDLACILGTNKPKNTAKVEPEKSINSEKEETFGVKTIHGGSLVDYFSNKWAEMKKGGKKVIGERNSNHVMSLSESNSGDAAPVELDSKKKKAKKRKHSISEENVDINNECLNLNNQLEEANNEGVEEIKISEKNNFDKKKAKKSKTALTDCYSEISEIQNKSKHHLEQNTDKIDGLNSISETCIDEVSLNKRKKEKIFDENESETVKNNKLSVNGSKSEEVEVESIEGKKIKKEKKKKKEVEEFIQELSTHEVERIEEDKENKEAGRKEKKKKKKSEENVQVDESLPHLQDASVCKGSGMEKINGRLLLSENEDVEKSKKDKKDKKQKRNKSESSITPNDSTKLDQTVQNDSEITERNQNYEKPKKKKERKHDGRINNDKGEVERLEEEINLNEVNPENEEEEEEGGKNKTKKKKKKKMKNEEDNRNEELKNFTEAPEKKSKKKKKEKIQEVQIESTKDSNAIEKCRLKGKKTKKHKINEDKSIDTSTIEPECKNGGKISESEESLRHPKDQNKSFIIQNGPDNSSDVIYTHKAIGLNKKKYPASTQNMSNDKALKMYCGAEVNQFNGSNLADLEGYGNSLMKTNPR